MTQLMFGMKLPTETRRSAAQRDVDPRVKALVISFYNEKVGYHCPTFGKEAAAASRILKANYTPAQVFGCYDYLKAQTFWSDKVVSLMTVLINIGEWVKNKQPEKTAPTARELRDMPAWERRGAERKQANQKYEDYWDKKLAAKQAAKNS